MRGEDDEFRSADGDSPSNIATREPTSQAASREVAGSPQAEDSGSHRRHLAQDPLARPRDDTSSARPRRSQEDDSTTPSPTSPATDGAQVASGAVTFQLGLIVAATPTPQLGLNDNALPSPTSPAIGGAQTASGAAVTQVATANDSSENPHGPENNDLQDLLDSDDEDLAMFAETGKGASQQAKRPRSGDPLHSTAPMEYELSQEVRPVGLIPRADSLKRQKQIDTAGLLNSWTQLLN